MTPTRKRPRYVLAALIGGGVGGVADMAAALVLFGITNDASPIQVLLAVASGVFGEEAMSAGGLMAAVGFGLHMVIAFGAAAVYLVAMTLWPRLFRNLHLACFTFSVGIYIVMNHVVVPLSRTVFVPSTEPAIMATRFVIQLVTVAYSIAIAAEFLVRRRLAPVANAVPSAIDDGG